MRSRTQVNSAEIEDVRQRLEEWRRTREGRGHIPERLWALAVQVARKCGLNQTARALRINYYALKKRLEPIGSGSRKERETRPSFLELVPPQVAACECVVELEDAGGAKMRIELKSSEAPDLVALSTAFWSSRR